MIGAAAGRKGGARGAGRRGAARIAGWVLLALAALVLVLTVGRAAGGAVHGFLSWVGGLGPLAPVLFVLGYVVATVGLVPGSLLTLAAGAIFGLLHGTVYALTGATLGAAAAFLVSRHLARPGVERWLGGDGRFERIDRAVEREGRRVVLLLRLSPAFPFILLNYALGLTRVRFVDFLVGSAGMLPGTLLYVYYGRVIGDIAALAAGETAERGAAHYLVLALGLLATVAATLVITRLARRALREAALEPEAADAR
jgi:uncharacterized membrane protein YdjX (TVP38/TMEM64 family)